MEITAFVFLSSGLLLGWALGANNLANIFGTAVGTGMVRFTTAAAIASVALVLGATISGAGTAETMGRLSTVGAPAGAFMAALAAAVAIAMMTRSGLPVSTTHSLVGAIIGWNLFSGTWVDTDALVKILIGWVLGPVLAIVGTIPLFIGTTKAIDWTNLHLLRIDAYTRLGLIAAGAFGAYSLGANNVANAIGVFVPLAPLTAFSIGDSFQVSSAMQLSLLGGLAMAAGVCTWTYSARVIQTVGKGIFTLSPVAAWVVVMAHSIVLFLFSSRSLEALLARHGLPTLPLVPISSSEVIVGSVLGIAFLKGTHNIRWIQLVRIGAGWLLTPVIAGIICFIGLFFLQNVFNQPVS